MGNKTEIQREKDRELKLKIHQEQQLAHRDDDKYVKELRVQLTALRREHALTRSNEALQRFLTEEIARVEAIIEKEEKKIAENKALLIN